MFYYDEVPFAVPPRPFYRSVLVHVRSLVRDGNGDPQVLTTKEDEEFFFPDTPLQLNRMARTMLEKMLGKGDAIEVIVDQNRQIHRIRNLVIY